MAKSNSRGLARSYCRPAAAGDADGVFQIALNAAELAAWVAMQRNDLEAPAMRLLPVIGQVRAALSAQQGCLVSRMSGSGATCFGLFPDPLSASAAARAIRAAQPAWWVADAPVLQDQS